MTNVGKLNVEIGADSAPLERGLDAARRAAERAGREVEQAANAGERGFAGLETRIGSVAQRIAGLGGLGSLGIGGIASAAVGAFVSNFNAQQQERADQARSLAGIGADAAERIGAANRSTLTPTAALESEQRAQRVAFLRQNAERLEQLRQESQTFGGRLRGFAGIFARAVEDSPYAVPLALQRRLVPGLEFLQGGILEGVDNSDDIARELRLSNVRGQVFANNQGRVNEAEVRAAEITATPQFQSQQQIDLLQQLVRGIERLNERGGVGTPPPGGVAP